MKHIQVPTRNLGLPVYCSRGYAVSHWSTGNVLYCSSTLLNFGAELQHHKQGMALFLEDIQDEKTWLTPMLVPKKNPKSRDYRDELIPNKFQDHSLDCSWVIGFCMSRETNMLLKFLFWAIWAKLITLPILCVVWLPQTKPVGFLWIMVPQIF